MAIDSLLYARSFGDVYDDWYGDLDDPQPLVGAFTERCPPGATVLELGSGTGRLATPLTEAGFLVLALDVSQQMLRGAAAGPEPVAGDMAALPFRNDSVDVVLVAYNTFFNISSRAQQQRCMDECARVLRRGGLLVIEAFIAAGTGQGFGVSSRVHPTQSAARLMIVTGPGDGDDDSSDDVIVGSHVEIGRSITCRPWRLCYRSPTQLDQLATDAALELVYRASDWNGTGFDADGLRHVSWYERS